MEESILNFGKQFSYEPEINNQEFLKDFDHIIFCGLGGSHLAADLVKTLKPGIDIYVHKDYGLPPYEEEFLKRALFIACSYSGNTEEVLSFYDDAYGKEYSVAVISTGGELLEKAKEDNIPFIEIPKTDIQPRLAIGFLSLAIFKFLNDDESISILSLLEDKINSESLKEKAEELVEKIGDKIPVVYSSNRNLHLAYNWKIKFNETAKIPAFYNVFPELNHNEMQGFDSNEGNNLCVIFIEDKTDNARIQKRMEVTKEIYSEKGIQTISVELSWLTREENIYNSILLADWVSLLLAEKNNKEPEQVPLIEDFKKRLK